MTHKHLFRFCLLVSLAVISLNACKKDPIGTISGTLTVYDPSTPLVKTPVDSIKMYLINMDFKMDTVNFEKNRAALIDSTYTDAAGKYTFTALPEGKYAIAAALTKQNYFFVPENADKDPYFSITAGVTDHEINFTAPIPDSNNDAEKFHMTINSVNRPASGYIIVKRQHWILWVIPIYVKSGKIEGDSGLYEDEYQNLMTAVGWNAWFLETWILKDGKETKVKSYWLKWEMWNMPDKLTVTIDWDTQKMTVVEGK